MPERVPFLRLSDDYEQVREHVERRFAEVLASQVFVLGPQTRELERAFETLTGAAHAVACGSGTDALSLALAACGIGAGDAVVIPAMTFVATGSTVARSGATPVFADVDAATFNLGADQLRSCIELHFERDDSIWRLRGSGAALRAVLPVHLFGRAVDMGAIGSTAREYGAIVIEDAAQAVGASGARRVGAWGAAACFSFYPTKNLGGAGDGGMVTTGDAAIAERLRSLRVHGAAKGGDRCSSVGFNARMDELQAAYLNAKLPMLEAWTRQRARVAARYDAGLSAIAALGRAAGPGGTRPPEHVYHQYVVRIPAAERERVIAELDAAGVDVRVFYRTPLHRQPCFDGRAPAADCPVADGAAAEVLSLPIYPSLGDATADRVAAALTTALS